MKRNFESKQQKKDYQLYKKFILNVLKHNTLCYARLNSLHNVCLYLCAEEYEPILHNFYYQRVCGLYKDKEGAFSGFSDRS